MKHAALALAVGLVVVSCDDVNVHILSANQYDAADQCVTASDGVDVVAEPLDGGQLRAGVPRGQRGRPVVRLRDDGVRPPYPGDYTSRKRWTRRPVTPTRAPAHSRAYAAYENDGAICAPVGTDAASDASDAASDADDGGGDDGDDGGGGSSSDAANDVTDAGPG